MSHSVLQINIDTQNMPVNFREQRSFATTYWYSKYTYILTKERSPARENVSTSLYSIFPKYAIHDKIKYHTLSPSLLSIFPQYKYA